MKILYVVHQFYPEYSSGTEKFLLQLSSAVQRDGIRAEIVTYRLGEQGKRGDSRRLSSEGYDYQNIPVVSVRHTKLPADLNLSLNNQDIRHFSHALLKRRAYDLVHFAHPMRLTPFANEALELGIPYVVTLTDFWLICPKVVLQTSSGSLCAGPAGGEACRELCPELPVNFVKARLQLARKFLCGARALIAPSRFLATLYKKEMPDLAISVVPHGMDCRYLKPNQRRYRAGDRIVFGYCGSFVPHKGVHLLLRAFRRLQDNNSELHLYGTASDDQYERLLKETAGDDPRIQWCGTYRAEQVGTVLQGIDVMIVPSLCYESYGFTLHEALACDVPVVTSDIGNPGQKVAELGAGITFRVGDENDLRSKLESIVAEPEALNGMKQNINGHILPRVEEEAYSYQRIYRTALEQSKRA